MKKIILFFLIATGLEFSAQTNADCINYIPLCATPNFTFYPTAGNGQVNDIPNGNNISNPLTNPNPPNAGCLLQGENVPQWLLITVGNSGFLEFVFGAGNSPNPQIGFYDWSMWPYSPTACAGIMNNTLPPIRCNWNAVMNGGTGIAGPGNIPPGGDPGNYEAPLAVNACQQFIICISNFSGVNTLVSFQSLGTASLSCNPNCAPSYSMCAGNSVTITAVNFAGLMNPTFSIQPGGQSNNTGTFAVSPSVTTNYTLYTTGTNQQNVVQTTTGVSTVTVFPKPVLSPSFTQATCANTINAVNLGLSFNPPGSPNYTVNWSPVPPGPPTPTQTTVNGLSPGVTNVTVTAAGGCATTTSFVMTPIPSYANFTLNPPGPTFSLTCTNSVVALTASPNSHSYTWTSVNNPTLSGASVSFTSPGVYTVAAGNGISGCSTQQTLSIGQNTAAPVNSVNPVMQTVDCYTTSLVTFTGTAISPTINIQHDWYSPLNPPPGGVPVASSNNTTSVLSANMGPGVYTLVTTNLVNGCTAYKTFTITALTAYPSFSMASPTGFSVGCAPNKNTTTLTIVDPVSTQTPPATTSWTFLPPGFAGVVSPSIILNTVNNSTTTTTPGTWTVIVQDNSNFCRTQLLVPVVQNTVPPHVLASMATQTLLCKTPTILATGSSSTANTSIEWNVALPPPNNLPSSTLVIGTPSVGPPTSSTSLSYANYTVIATNTVNGCTTSSVVSISQNFKPPVSDPKISVATPTAIYCTAAIDPVRLTTGNSTVTSGMTNAFVSPLLWQGPPPQYTATGVSTYSAFIVGTYSLTVIDSENGCTKTNTIEVLDRTQPPVITNPVSTATMECGATSAILSFVLTGTTSGGYKYYVNRYPTNVAFSPNAANDITQGGTTSPTVAVSKTGYYTYIVTNTLTGCQAQGTINVVDGTLNAGFDPDPVSGYAPLGVTFNNTTVAGGSSQINVIWNYGNGSTSSSTANANGATSYAAAGTYTVMMIAQKGSCVDTAYRVVKVDLPSKLEVPNVFTPNDDGNNDVFFLKVANISEISAFIMDRWGNKVYEVISSTGNIAWDGKNLAGEKCPAGVYLYVIKASGKDDTAYEKKGNVTLIR